MFCHIANGNRRLKTEYMMNNLLKFSRYIIYRTVHGAHRYMQRAKSDNAIKLLCIMPQENGAVLVIGSIVSSGVYFCCGENPF